MNINENLKNKGKIKNTAQIADLATNHHQTNIVVCSESLVLHFDKFFHLMVLYENYLICIFMNINENLK